MCGIVGYIGKNKALPILIQGLKSLEYRGYDSAGVAYLKDKNINVIKSVGKIEKLEKKINLNDDCFIGIGHTRWATHGKVTESNCHPHQKGNIVLVHNGILENYLELKNKLIENNYSFYGDTDTEVIASYIDFYYSNNKDKSFINVLDECSHIFKGSFAIVGMFDNNNKLFFIKKDSPLIIGMSSNNDIYISSDIIAYQGDIVKSLFLNDMDVGIIDNNKINIYNNGNKRCAIFEKIEKHEQSTNKGNFSHYMLKEIYEEADLVNHWNSLWLNKLDTLPDISKYSKIHIIGCGTAYHAGLIGKYFIENFKNIEVNVFIASEYRYQKLFLDENTLAIFVSQSGETADTLACLKKVKNHNIDTLGIINVKSSSIARLVDKVIYTSSGVEIAVASTKAYLSQIYIFSLLAIKDTNLSFNIDKYYLNLDSQIKALLEYDYEKIAKIINDHDDVFFIGRSHDYITMLEGALKLKEISYIHAEAFQAGELKHGSIALIEEKTPVVALISKEDIADKTFSNIEEVLARGACVLLLITSDLVDKINLKENHNVIVIPKTTELLQPLLNVIPLQMIAYNVAKLRGVDIDKPRNLAKSVTVE